MRGYFRFFDGLVRVPLVRWGADFKHKRKDGDPGHIASRVYAEMLLQVCRDYPGLPDPRTLRASEIRFFYEGLREELKEATKPSTPKG